MKEEVSLMGDYLAVTHPQELTLNILGWAFSNLRTKEQIAQQIKHLEEIDAVGFSHDVGVLRWAIKRKD